MAETRWQPFDNQTKNRISESKGYTSPQNLQTLFFFILSLQIWELFEYGKVGNCSTTQTQTNKCVGSLMLGFTSLIV
jgi:hypothetical protein